MESQTKPTARLRRIGLSLQSDQRFAVPLSDGYSVYSALLSALKSSDADASARVHDSDIGSMHNSGLQGSFGNSDRPHHKLVRSNEEYQLSLGITDPDDEIIFQALVSSLVMEGDSIELTNGSLRIESFESENTSHEALLEKAADLGGANLKMDFQTATCIEEAGSVTTMFPHRVAVFSSLLGKWNQTAPDDLELDVSRDTLASSVIEKPDDTSYQTHSVLVNRVKDDDGNPHPIFRQGFSGRCEYAFKDASNSVENALTALTLFAEYSGVGSAVARGCGDVTMEVNGQ